MFLDFAIVIYGTVMGQARMKHIWFNQNSRIGMHLPYTFYSNLIFSV